VKVYILSGCILGHKALMSLIRRIRQKSLLMVLGVQRVFFLLILMQKNCFHLSDQRKTILNLRFGSRSEIFDLQNSYRSYEHFLLLLICSFLFQTL
jgi:hypothetical protein